jgi:uncharacterized protein YwqG
VPLGRRPEAMPCFPAKESNVTKRMLILCLAAACGCGRAPNNPPVPVPAPQVPPVSLEVPASGARPDDNALKAAKDKLVAEANACGLSRIAGELDKQSQWSIRIRTRRANDRNLAIGVSKIGGDPDLPAGTEWPRFRGVPLGFLAQLKMVDAAKHDVSGSLPSSGLLSFFYDARQEAWGFDPKDRGGWRVLFFDGGGASLRRVPAPDDLPDESPFSPCKLSFSTELTPPPWESLYVKALALTEQERDKCVDLIDRTRGEDGIIHRLLGHPDPIQGDMQLECQLTFHGVYTGDERGYRNPRRAALEKGAADWQLLLQIDSDEENAGMMWGDSGRIYFWIRKADLKKRAFENVWMVLQCY